jgi:hypothetical protein
MREYINQARTEANEAFMVSSELIHLLGACFQNLRTSPKLQRIEIRGYNQPSIMAVLISLQHVDFPKNLVEIILRPNISAEEFSQLSNASSTHTTYIARLHVDMFVHPPHAPDQVNDLAEIMNILRTGKKHQISLLQSLLQG